MTYNYRPQTGTKQEAGPPFVPAGTPASVVVPAGVLQHGRTYRFRTSPYECTHYSNSCSSWSNWTTFTFSSTSHERPQKHPHDRLGLDEGQ